jgi:hypothetical protein
MRIPNSIKITCAWLGVLACALLSWREGAAGEKGKALEAGYIYVDERGDLEGVLYNLNLGDLKNFRVQVAIRQIAGDAWQVQDGLVQLEKNKAEKSSFKWKATGVRFGEAGAYDLQFEAVVALVDRRQPLRPGIINYETLERCALAVSERIRVLRKPKEPSVVRIRPRINITRVSGKSFDPGQRYHVKLKEVIEGKVHKPENCYVHLVVQPIEGGNRWIMHGGETGGDDWSCPAQFGREGMDLWGEFYAYAIVTTAWLDPDQGAIPPQRWQQYEQTVILAQSEVVRAIRLEPPSAIRELSIRITRIDNYDDLRTLARRIDSLDVRELGVAGDLLVCYVSKVSGTIEGRPLAIDERVWLLGLSPNGEWRLIGQATTGEAHWTLHYARLGDERERLKLVAVVSKYRVLDLNDEATQRNVQTSSQRVGVILTRNCMSGAWE